MDTRPVACSALLALLCGLPAPAADAPAKLTVAVMSLRSSSGITADDAELLSDRLRIELFNTGRYAVMERSQMQEILKEQGFQQSGACTDEGCMVEMGKLLGVQQLIGGSIGKLGSMYLVNLRCIDVKTAKIVAVVSEDVKGDIEEVVGVLSSTARRLASGGGVAPPPRPVQAEPRRAESKPAPQPAASAGSGSRAGSRCDEKVYLEDTRFGNEQFDSAATDAELQEMNSDITDALEESLDECLYDDVDDIEPGKLASMPACRAIVIRVSAGNFTTTPGSRGQVYGTVTAVLSFYDGTDATQPFHQETITAKGSQHWGRAIPFKNAFDEVAETVLGQDRSDYMSDARRRIRSLP